MYDLKRPSWLVIVSLVVATGCSDTLNQTRAESLLSGQGANHDVIQKIPVLNELAPGQPTFEGRQGDEMVQRLMSAGFISRKEVPRSIPSIAGRYEADIPASYADFVLTLTQSGRSVTGERQGTGVAGDKCAVKAEFGTDGILTFNCSDGTPDYSATLGLQARQPDHIRVVQHQDKTELAVYGWSFVHRAYSDVPWYIYSRSGNSGSLSVPVYTFQLSPTLDAHRSGAGFRVGQVRRVTLDRLLLDTETVASSDVVEETTLNSLGKAVLGLENTACRGKAKFGKQPDGKWVVTEWQRCTQG